MAVDKAGFSPGFQPGIANKNIYTKIEWLQAQIIRRRQIAGVAPWNNESAGKRYSGTVRKGDQALRVANVRMNALHQVTSRLARTKSAVVLEDLHVGGMVKNHHLAQAIADVGFYEYRRQMVYKG